MPDFDNTPAFDPSADELPPMHDFDQLRIPAVLVASKADAAGVLGEAGIHDPVILPVAFGRDAQREVGDGFTDNLIAIFQSADDEANPFADQDGDVPNEEAQQDPGMNES